MEQQSLASRRAAIIAEDGPWTAHNIYLGEGLHTFEEDAPGFQRSIDSYTSLLRRMLRIVADTTDRPLDQLRIMDLACLEGIYGIEFALHGAEVVGLEARETSLRKARFAAEALSLRNITFVQDDVRNLSREKYGQFDVVLCIGILYHLDVPDVFAVLESISDICKRLLILDTHVALRPNKTVQHRGVSYEGWSYAEFAPNTAAEVKRGSLWASIDNEQSFWFSRASLFNLLADVGFASVFDCQMPAFPRQMRDRDTLAAVKGPVPQVLSLPESRDLPDARWREDSRDLAEPSQEQFLKSLTPSLWQRLAQRWRTLTGV